MRESRSGVRSSDTPAARLTITGSPDAIASSVAKLNVSYRVGRAKQSAAAYRGAISVLWPRNVTRRLGPRCRTSRAKAAFALTPTARTFTAPGTRPTASNS